MLKAAYHTIAAGTDMAYTPEQDAAIRADLARGDSPTAIGKRYETPWGKDREAVRRYASRMRDRISNTSERLSVEVSMHSDDAEYPTPCDEPLDALVRNAVASEVDAITERILARLNVQKPVAQTIVHEVELPPEPPKRTAPTHGREVALFDIHHPHHDRAAWAAVCEFIGDYQPDVLILGGDAMDAGPFSHWNDRKLGLLKTMPDPHTMYGEFVSDILRPLRELAPDAYIVYLLGNHEDWVRQALEADPRGNGYWEVEKNLDGIPDEVIPYVDGTRHNHFQFGKLYFIHGYRTNMYHARYVADDYNRPVRYGHVHDVQTHTHRTAVDVRDFHIAQSCGCLCNLNPAFQKNRPNKWVHAFQYGEVQPDGAFSDYVPVIVNGRFRAEGEWYG